MILPVLRPEQRKGPPTPAHQQLKSLTNLYPRSAQDGRSQGVARTGSEGAS